LSLPLQTLKKIGILIASSLLPLVAFLILILLRFDLLTAAVVCILIGLVFVLIAHKITDSPFLRMFEGKTFGVITFDSRGKIDFFDVALEGDSFVGYFMGKKIESPFNSNFFWRISDVFKKGKMQVEGEKMVLTLYKENFNRSVFKTDFPILVWDKQLNSFITKDWLHTQEKKDMWFTKAFELKKEIIEYNRSASTITKLIVDMIGARLKQQSWIIWFIVLVVIGYILWQFWPVINNMLTGTIESGTNAVSGATEALPDKLV